MSKKPVVSNVKPFHCEVKNIRFSGFELWIYSSIKQKNAHTKITKIRLDWWFAAYIAEAIHKAIANLEKKIYKTKRQAKGDLLKPEDS